MLRHFPLFLPLPAALKVPLPFPASPACRTPSALFSPGLPLPVPFHTEGLGMASLLRTEVSELRGWMSFYMSFGLSSTECIVRVRCPYCRGVRKDRCDCITEVLGELESVYLTLICLRGM